MKEKIIARLRALYPGVNFSKARLDAIADKLKITEETEIDEKLNDLNEIFPFSELAKQDDRVRTLEAKEKKKTDPDPADPKPQDPPKDETDLQKIVTAAVAAAIAPMAQKISAFESGKTVESRKSKLEAKLKDAPEKYKATILKNFTRMNFETDEEFEAYLTETETDLTAFNQDLSNQALSNSGSPFKIATPGGKEASKEEVAELSKNLKF